MRTITIFFPVVVLLLSAICFPSTKNKAIVIDDDTIRQVTTKKQLFARGCAPDLSSFDLDDPGNVIPLLDGWGSYRMPVTVGNDSARIYFEQGINMYYGFHIIEALASFEKAVQFDSTFAMGYWGKALSYGPNINDLGYSASPDALTAVAKAKALYVNCTPVEKALVDAMLVRYSADTTQTREYLNQQYADAMRAVHTQFLSSADAAALYADALMVQHPWDLYDKYGKAKPWTPAIVAVLEGLTKEFPEHPGANHYYIHAIEGSDHPQDGIAVANRLGKFMPGVAHLVHMPSHIYIRSGYYNEGVEVNKDAVESYKGYLSEYPAVKNADYLYIIHNLHMEAACANMDVRYTDAMGISLDCRNSVDISYLDAGGYFGMYAQYIYMTPYLTSIRFGKWNEILTTPAIPGKYIYANLLWHYGRGIALARTHEIERAKAELDSLRADMPDPQLKESPPAFNPGLAGAGVAEKVLEALIAEEANDLPEAIYLYKKAVDMEDEMLYNEPKDWVHPVRQYLGNALVKAGKYKEAEKTFREDLKVNPNNAWSLTGLGTALVLQKKMDESIVVQTQAKEALKRSDVKIANAVF